ncbi:MAG: hypothetical protein U0133_08510 [Gemmatimonadales bacterium]
MTTPDSPSDAPLDFSAPAAAASTQSCVNCKQPIAGQYWTVNDALLCDSCKGALDRGQQVSTGITARTGRFARAALYGVGGMLAGATVWYAVAKLADLQIGLIAILLGWLVGKGVFAGSGNRGGRRYQVLAVVLTYMGIGLAFVPFAVEEMMKKETPAEITRSAAPAASKPAGQLTSAELEAEGARLDSIVAAGDSAAKAKAEEPGLLKSFAIMFGLAIAGIFTLPILTIFGGGFSIMSLIIYAIALMQAWKNAQAVKLPVQGPFQVGGPATA